MHPRRVWSAAVVVWLGLLSAATFCLPAVAQQTDSDTIITDIASWKDPAKTVLQANNVKLKKVEIRHTADQAAHKYFVFDVSFPYDPQSSETQKYFNKLYVAVLRATNNSNYALVDEDDRLRIEVGWDKSKKTMSLNLVPLQ
jgi:hypothetical protein